MRYVLVPGAGGDAWYWHRVVPLLRGLGHDAVAVDLPTGDDKAGLMQYAEAIVAAADGLGDVVLVAQSMGGFSAPLACDRLPVTQLVLVNAMIPAPGETAGDYWANTRQEEARRALDVRQGRGPDAEFDLLEHFFHDVPPDVTAEAMQAPPAQSDTPFGEPWPLAAWPDVPTRALSGREDRLFPLEYQQRVVRERLGLAVEPVPGGHLCALSRPDGLVARLTGAPS